MTEQFARASDGSLVIQAGGDVRWVPSDAAFSMTLTAQEFDQLTDLLDQLVAPSALAELFLAATGNRFEPPAKPDLGHYVDRLRALQPDCLFVFVELLAEHTADPESQRRLMRWTERVAPNYVDQADLNALISRRRPQVSGMQRCLSVRVEADALAAGAFHAYAWVGSAEPVPIAGPDGPLRMPELRAAVAALVAEQLPRETDPRRCGLIEFVLDPPMLNLRVETWPVHGGATQLGAVFPVVVRPVTPIGPERWGRVIAAEHYEPDAIAWLPGPAAVEPLCCAVRDPGLAADPSTLVAALTEVGAPVALWNRGPNPTDLAAVLHARGLSSLPHVLRAQRAAAAASSAPSGHPGWDVVLMWNDPRRAPWRKYRLQAPDRQRRKV